MKGRTTEIENEGDRMSTRTVSISQDMWKSLRILSGSGNVSELIRAILSKNKELIRKMKEIRNRDE